MKNDIHAYLTSRNLIVLSKGTKFDYSKSYDVKHITKLFPQLLILTLIDT